MEAPKSDKPRKFLRAVQALSFVVLVVFALHAGLHFGGKSLDSLFNDWVYTALVLISALSCLVRASRSREHRPAWLLIGAGRPAWAAAEVYRTFVLSNVV